MYMYSNCYSLLNSILTPSLSNSDTFYIHVYKLGHTMYGTGVLTGLVCVAEGVVIRCDKDQQKFTICDRISLQRGQSTTAYIL